MYVHTLTGEGFPEKTVWNIVTSKVCLEISGFRTYIPAIYDGVRTVCFGSREENRGAYEFAQIKLFLYTDSYIGI